MPDIDFEIILRNKSDKVAKGLFQLCFYALRNYAIQRISPY